MPIVFSSLSFGGPDVQMAAVSGLCQTLHGACSLSSSYSRSGAARPLGQLVCASRNMEPSSRSLKLLFVEMGVGYDQHGQDITAAAVRACKNAISSNSIPAFRTGAIPGVSWQEMKLKLKLGVPKVAQGALDIEKVKAVFPYGEIIDVDVVDGGLICSSGVALEAMGDKNDDCYVVNAAIYVGY